MANIYHELSEKIELEALLSLHKWCPVAVRDELGLEILEVDGVTVACASHEPSTLLNRTLGLGVHQAPTPQTIDQICRIYETRGIKNFLVHAYQWQINEDIEAQMIKDNLVPGKAWIKYRRDGDAIDEAESPFLIEAVKGNQANDFGLVVCEAFGLSKKCIPLLASMAHDERWFLFVSYDDGEPAGAGALFIEGDSAWLEWGATREQFRGRGSQAAIMTKRINMANMFGCKYLFTETAETEDGDPQHSYNNIIKAGFKKSSLRANYKFAGA